MSTYKHHISTDIPTVLYSSPLCLVHGTRRRVMHWANQIHESPPFITVLCEGFNCSWTEAELIKIAFDHIEPTGAWGPFGVASSWTNQGRSPGYPEKDGAVASEAHVHTRGPGGGQPKRRLGAVQQGPAPFHWKRGHASGCQWLIWEPYCQSRQAWRRGFQWVARSTCCTAAQTGLQHCICASWWYAK